MKFNLPQAGSLGARAMQAAGWSFVITISSYALRLVSNLIMTRLLVPEAFGMIAMANVLLTALALFTDIGIGRSISREQDGAEPKFLRVAWVVKILRSACVAGGVLFMALLLWLFGAQYAPSDSVYARPEMPGLIALVALSPIFLGFASTSWELAVRRLEYHRFVLFGIISQILSIVAMVSFAMISPTVWALMSGMLIANVLQCWFTHVFLPGPRMQFAWDREIVDRLWHFGKWLIGSSALSFFARNADKLLLGGLLGAVNFGIYTIAQIWIDAGKMLISRLSEGVGFPAIAEVIRTRPQDVARLYGRYQRIIDAICATGFLATFFGATFLIELLYTQEYGTAGPYLQLMSLSFLIIRFDTLGSLVLNFGNSRALMFISLIRLIAILVLLPIGYYLFGVPGAILAAVLTPGVTAPYVISLTAAALGRDQTRFSVLWLIATIGIASVVFNVSY